MKVKLKRTIITILALAGVFIVSYSVAFLYFKNTDIAKKNKLIQTENEQKLSESTVVSLYKGDVLEEEKTIEQLKPELSLQDDVTQEALSSALINHGYTLEQKIGNEIFYKRDINKSIIPNKYYIKEYEGYLAIYKANADGQLTIEDTNSDIFKDKKKFADLPEGDKEMINNLELVYDTKDEARMDITDIIS